MGIEPIAAAAQKGFITQQATRAQKRGAFSFLTVLCDDPRMHPVVPQVIISNEHILPEKVRIALEEESLLMEM